MQLNEFQLLCEHDDFLQITHTCLVTFYYELQIYCLLCITMQYCTSAIHRYIKLLNSQFYENFHTYVVCNKLFAKPTRFMYYYVLPLGCISVIWLTISDSNV